MIIQKHLLNELIADWRGSSSDAYLSLYLQQASAEIDASRIFPCVVLCPGGGYSCTSDREAEPVALRFAAHGYHVAVVRYSVDLCRWPTQLCELSAVMAWLRRNAQELRLDSNRIIVCGFSAGGHLAASLANFHSSPIASAGMQLQPGENRPNVVILGYPVISSGCFGHAGCFRHLLGDAYYDPDALAAVSLENSTNSDCPPCFIWHTATDTGVPVENSLLYAQALSRYHIPLEVHIYPLGSHALSLADHTTTGLPQLIQPYIAGWFDECLCFLEQMGLSHPGI